MLHVGSIYTLRALRPAPTIRGMFAASQLSQVAGAGQVAPVPERQEEENKVLLRSHGCRAG